MKFIMGITSIPFADIFNSIKNFFISLKVIVDNKVVKGFIEGIKSMIGAIVSAVTKINMHYYMFYTV